MPSYRVALVHASLISNSSVCRLLGHEVEAQALRVAMPARLSAPHLPELNYSQVSAVQSVLQAPLSLIQGARHV